MLYLGAPTRRSLHSERRDAHTGFLSASVAGFDPKFDGSGLNEVCFDSKSGSELAVSDQKFYRSIDPYMYVGDTSKLSIETGWKPTRKFTEVIEEMTKVDISRVSK